MMHKRLFLSVLFLNLLFVSCESESADPDPEEPLAETELLGTWNYVAYIDDDGEEPATDCEQNQTLTFEEDGVFRFTYYDDSEGPCEKTQDSQGTWEFVSDAVIKTDYTYGDYVDQDKFEVGFEISGNTLTLYLDEGEGEYQERYEKQ